jgi:hypothetical protein
MLKNKADRDASSDELNLEQLEEFSDGRIANFDVMLAQDDGGTGTSGTRSKCHIDGTNEPAD